MTSRSRAKRQHYVPQFYLRAFEDLEGHIWVYDKWRHKIFNTDKGNIAAEGGFNDLPDSTNPPASYKQMPEAVLDQWEQRWAKSVHRVIERAEAGDKSPLSEKDKLQLAHFLIVQFFRTKEARVRVLQMAEGIRGGIETLSEQIGIPLSDKYQIDTDAGSVRLTQLRTLFNRKGTNEAAALLLKHIWVLGRNMSDMPLYTSDSAIVMHAHDEDFALAGIGIEIALPLSPNYALVLLERTFHTGWIPVENKTVPLSRSDIQDYNIMQIANSHRQVYSHTNDFDLVRDICEAHPEVCAEGRPRQELVIPDIGALLAEDNPATD